MVKLFNIELIKLLRYKTFWFFLGAYLIIFLGVVKTIGDLTINGQQFDVMQFFAFPGIWHNMAYIASYLNYIIGILAILLITNEFTYRTLRQNITDGLSRFQVVLSKLIIIGVIAFVCTLVVALVSLISGLSYGLYEEGKEIFQKIYFPGLLFLQIMGYVSIASLLSFLIKRPALSILAFLLYGIAVEPLVRLQVSDVAANYFPLKAFGHLIPFSGEQQIEQMTGFAMGGLPLATGAAVSLAYITLFWTASYFWVKRMDL